MIHRLLLEWEAGRLQKWKRSGKIGTVAREEGERDRRVDLGEQPDRPCPEALELGPQLVGERDPGLDEVLSRAVSARSAFPLRALRPSRRVVRSERERQPHGDDRLHAGAETGRCPRRRPASPSPTVTISFVGPVPGRRRPSADLGPALPGPQRLRRTSRGDVSPAAGADSALGR